MRNLPVLTGRFPGAPPAAQINAPTFLSLSSPKSEKNLGESLGRVSPSGNSKHLIAFFDETHSSIVGGAHMSRVKRMRKMKRRKTGGETKEEEKEKKNAA